MISKEDFRELSKAVGLAAHGVGIGSFAYLRRIFERMIDDAEREASQQEGWDHDSYSRSRMNEKIGMLKGYVPDFLFEHRSVYGVMSIGIHELSEDVNASSTFP